MSYIKENDIFYYNINIAHDDNAEYRTTPAIYNANLNQPLLSNPSEWYMLIQKFYIPTQVIPLTIPQIENPQPIPTPVGGITYFRTLYNVYIGVRNGGNITYYSANVKYFQYRNPEKVPLPNGPSVIPGYYYYDNTDTFFFIYSYQHFIDMINNAFLEAFNSIPSPPVGSSAPYLEFNSKDQLISLVGQKQYYDSTIANTMLIYVNLNLFRFLDGLDSIFTYTTSVPETIVQFPLKYNGHNLYAPPGFSTYDYYIMTQQYQTLADWNCFRQLIITSNNMPITNEYYPVTKSSSALTRGLLSNATNIEYANILNTRSILTSFIPLVEKGSEARTSVEYIDTNILNGPLINLTGTEPLYKIDLQIYWVDNYNNFYQVYLPHHVNAIFKVAFIKKTLYDKISKNTI